MFTEKKLVLSRSLLIVCMAVTTINTISVKADFTFGSLTNLGPTVNSSAGAEDPEISADGLKLYFNSNRTGGYGKGDIWVTSRATIEDNWEIPTNLGLTVNSSSDDFAPDVSPDGLILHFASDRPGGYGNYDLWVTSRITIDDDWGTPENLGPNVNSSSMDGCPAISEDGLELYFWSNRPGGSGSTDLWIATRATIEDNWSTPMNLGPVVNSSAMDFCPYISADCLSLFFISGRSGGFGGFYGDIWITTRSTISDPWGTPVNLGPMVNSSASEGGPALSPDGTTFYFSSEKSGGFGSFDIWQVSINPIVDFNGNGIVYIKDLLRLIQSWGQYDPVVDIAPPLGDGVVDVLDLEFLMNYWEQSIDDPTLLAHWALDEAEGTIAFDSTGVNDAVVVGGTEWQPSGGKVDGAIQLNGVDGCAIANQVMNPADGPFSVFAWIKGGAPGQVIISQLNGTNWLRADSDFGCVMTELIPPAAGRFVPLPLISESVITDGEWHRIGFVWDGANRALYVDDMLVAEDTQANLQGSDNGLYIGTGKAMELGTYWSGLIDDVRIYNRAVRP
jgi:Tol biopolymer transport system component